MKRIHVLLVGLLIAFGASLHAVQSTINVGSSANDGTGDTLRSAMQKVNSNFTELYGTIFSFNGNQFGTSSSTNVYIKSGATLTNSVLYGSTSGSWAIGSDGTITAASSSATNMLSANIVNNTSVNSRARQGGLAFDGVTSGRKISHASFGTIATSDCSFEAIFVYPSTSNPSSDEGIMYAGADSGGANVASVALNLRILNTGELAFGVQSTGGYTYYKVASFPATYGGKAVHVVATRSGTANTFYINGVLQTTSTLVSGSVPLDSSISSSYVLGGVGVGGVLSSSTLYAYRVFNRVLSASEVVDLANKGVAEADKWASLTVKNVSTCIAAGTYDSFTGATSSGFRIVKSGTAGYAWGGSADEIVIKAGKKYRVTGTLTLNSGSLSNISWVCENTPIGSIQATFDSSTVAAGAFDKVFTATADNTCVVGIEASPATTFDITISGLTITQIGCLLDADLAVGVGYQAPDRSSNHYDGLISTSGVSHVIEQRRGQSRFSLSADGYLGDTTSRACIPDNARIESITAYSTGTPTFTVGDDSGSSANVVGSVTLTASTLTDLTLLKRFLTTGTDGRCYVDFTSGAAATTFTITYSTTGNY